MTLCHGEDPELWFPERRNTTAQAVAICHRCPVLEDCRQHALEHRIAHGVWGGLTEDERRKILGQRKPRVRKRHPPSPYPRTPSVKKLAPHGADASDVRGVSWNARKGRWVVVIRHRNRMHWAGQFTEKADAEAAAIAKCVELGISRRAA